MGELELAEDKRDSGIAKMKFGLEQLIKTGYASAYFTGLLKKLETRLKEVEDKE